MIIKTSEGDKSVASAGVGGAGLGLGIAGTALALMNGGCGNGILGGLFGGNCNQQVSALQAELAKEKAERYADSVGIDVYKEAISLSNKNDDKINSQFKEFAAAYAALDKQSAVNNATLSATISCLQNQVAQLQGLTKLVVPNASVCPGWGNVTITPSTTTSTTPAA